MTSTRYFLSLAVVTTMVLHLTTASLIINNATFTSDPIPTAQYFYKGTSYSCYIVYTKESLQEFFRDIRDRSAYE